MRIAAAYTLALTLLFVSGGAEHALAMSASVVDDFADARRELRSDDDQQRQAAVRALAKLNTEAAWELVLSVLGDPEPRIADEAQLVLAGAGPEFDELLLGKQGFAQKQGLTSLRIAECLGRRAAPLPAATWRKLLRHKHVAVRRSLFWSVERLGSRVAEGEREELAELLEQAAERDKDELARAHAWLALAAVDPGRAASTLRQRASSKSTAARASCAERIELAPAEAQLELLATLARDEALVVRLRAYQACARRRDRAGARALAAGLEAEAQLRLAWHLVEQLQALSGRKTALNVQAWSAWAEGLREDWTPAEQDSARDYGDRTASFVGLPVLSDRLAFLVDFSGSMWTERDGHTRKQAVDVEVRRVLEALPEDAEFNLHPFVDAPQSWQKRLTAASKKQVAKALDYFEGNRSQGKGDYWEAISLAMADPRVDTLMILGDGAPSGGERWNLALIAPLFAHENRFRGVFVDALLIDTKGRLRGYWEELTAQSGGRCIVVDL